MAKQDEITRSADSSQNSSEVKLEGGTYEIIRARLNEYSKDLRGRLDKLNASRKDVFGSIETTLTGSERITTDNNCVPRDIVPIGRKFIFGYNVFIGLRSETNISDVFAVYKCRDGSFESESLDIINDSNFISDFQNLYKYYRNTQFAKFSIIGQHLFMVFRIGKEVDNIKTFKWLIREDSLEYIDNRSDHEFVYPPQHEFEFKRVTHEMHRNGRHPHISIEDRVFVETLNGDLTIKIEDNTETGEGIFSEAVENRDQTLDDADIYYAIVENTILLKIKPYQESGFRYIVFNEKTQSAVRIDSIEDACVLLPEGHGLVFPKGYYLQTGEQKLFDSDMAGMIFEKRLSSPNGEDYLYVFYNRESGSYVLLSYNVISQTVNTPIVCHGYSFFDDGSLVYFRADGQAQKYHTLQIWQTPYCKDEYAHSAKTESYLYKIGNKDIVRCMADCNELVILIGKEDSYANLYIDISKKAGDISDAYFWLDLDETYHLDQPLSAICKAATSAIEEHEKVVRARRRTNKQTNQVAKAVRETIRDINSEILDDIDKFVRFLADLRAKRGEVISLKDLRYADIEQIDALDAEVVKYSDDLSGRCVEFLLEPDSLSSYTTRVKELGEKGEKLAKVSEAKALLEQVSQCGSELEMLTEIVSNLKIEDATQTTVIIDNISLIYSKLNQVKSSLSNRMKTLGRAEGQAEFAAQIKLIDQAVTNYLDVCDSPEKCDEYLTRVMVQLETLEAKFADFDEFIVQLAEKRDQQYNAFESRKVQLVEQRNKRATALMTAAERILKGIRNRVNLLQDVNEINAYFASDLMIERLRETVEQLLTLGDSVKAEDIQSQLKSIQQDAVRQLKDKQALFEDGENIIRLGEHRFAVNKQELELTTVIRDGEMFFHLAGTGFFEKITDQQLLSTKDVWDMELLSESQNFYRAEYLAGQILNEITAGTKAEFEKISALEESELLKMVQEFMAPRFAEGYIKGVHDVDACKILRVLIELTQSTGLLRFPSDARALALLVCYCRKGNADFVRLRAEIAGLGRMQGLLDYHGQQQAYISRAEELICNFVDETGLFEKSLCSSAAEYIFHEIADGPEITSSSEAEQLLGKFRAYLKAKNYEGSFNEAIAELADEPVSRFSLISKWLRSFTVSQHGDLTNYIAEAALMLLDSSASRRCVKMSTSRKITKMLGSHPLLNEGEYLLDYPDFIERFRDHQSRLVPRFNLFQQLKKDILDKQAELMRLDEFKPRVLTTFVRNRLIDKLYLKLIGDNLAKQIGTSGGQKRTDRQGMLLLISPPGYGKTTLMEYVSNRLGLIFMKINGPAIGNSVTSLDPAEASNAASREEVQKLNLAFEMGDNVMIYLDDIQHCNPEFLQKFISLCDAQRRIEGVYKGRTRTYDLRGKRVCVVMAGNPYTESGEKFRIPDMLSNRADTYNIGDIVGDNYDIFIDSYVENCLTSNPVLSKLANRSQADVYAVMQMASTGQREGIDFEGQYSADELEEYVATMKKLNIVREVVLKVNQQYIRSAAQADEYRTEPQFLLQGSYRNMNRIASRVLPVMNDQELWTLIQSCYEQDAQTLTSGTESNLLKFKQLVDRQSEDEFQRWQDICKTFNRNKLFSGDNDDKMNQVIGSMRAFHAALESIRDTIAKGVGQIDAKDDSKEDIEKQTQLQTIERFGQSLDGIKKILSQGLKKAGSSPADDIRALGSQVLNRLNDVIEAVRFTGQLQQQTAERHEALTINDNAQTMVAVLEEQFKTMERWLSPVVRSESGRQEYVHDLVSRFESMASGYNSLVKVLKEKMSDTDQKMPEDESLDNSDNNPKGS